MFKKFGKIYKYMMRMKVNLIIIDNKNYYDDRETRMIKAKVLIIKMMIMITST